MNIRDLRHEKNSCVYGSVRIRDTSGGKIAYNTTIKKANLKPESSARKKELEHRTKKLQEVAQVINEIGASEAELRDLIKNPIRPSRAKQAEPNRSKSRGVKKGTKIPKKYQLREGNKIHKWTGRGRMPLVFKEYIDSGGSLAECLIEK